MGSIALNIKFHHRTAYGQQLPLLTFHTRAASSHTMSAYSANSSLNDIQRRPNILQCQKITAESGLALLRKSIFQYRTIQNAYSRPQCRH